MAKITRKTQKTFGSSAGATGITEYGSPAGGSPAYSTDPDDIQTTEWETGWSAAALAGTEIPTFQDFNAIHFVATRQIGYLLQEGIAEYDSGTEYHENSIVKKSGTYELYGSKTNSNTGNALPSQTDNTDWQYLGDLADLVNAGTVSDATTTVKGVVEVATESEIEAETATGGTGASLVMTPADAKHHPSAAKFWVRFNGTGTVAINDSYNVSSITDNGTGDYTVNFTDNFANANYCVMGSAGEASSPYDAIFSLNSSGIAVGSVNFQTIGSGGSLNDYPVVCVTGFGEQ